jgi:hypothetical protein
MRGSKKNITKKHRITKKHKIRKGNKITQKHRIRQGNKISQKNNCVYTDETKRLMKLIKHLRPLKKNKTT